MERRKWFFPGSFQLSLRARTRGLDCAAFLVQQAKTEFGKRASRNRGEGGNEEFNLPF